MATKGKNTWILLIFIFAGVVIGGLIGEITSNIEGLWWLSYGDEFGLASPIVLDLSVIKLTIGAMLKVNIASVIGVAIALVVYKKV